jgi:nucleoside-diphosphate-sugar epimerase
MLIEAKGVDAVAHLASPVSLRFTDPEPVMHAAVNGVVRMLESASKEPSIKTFVDMSSVVAVFSFKDVKTVFSEKDWNEQSLQMLAAKGKDTPGPIIYFASKTAAEKALWKFRDEHKPSFNIAAVNPV